MNQRNTFRALCILALAWGIGLACQISGATLAPWLESVGHATVAADNPINFGPVTITVESNGAFDQALIFDSGVPIDRDPDLLTFSGWAIGISENGLSGQSLADDEARGGSIRFDFAAPITSFSFRPIDAERVPGSFIGQGIVPFFHYVNGGTSFDLPQFGADGEAGELFTWEPDTPMNSVTLYLGGSGAAGDIQWTSTIPEPDTALFIALGFSLLLLRRKRTQTKQ